MKIRRFVLTTAVGLLTCISAWAYVPPSQYLVKNWIAKRQGAKIVRIKTLVSGMDGDKPSSVRFRAVTLFNTGTRELKSWATDESDHKLYAVDRRMSRFPPLDALLLDSEVREVSHALRDARIPIRTDDELLAMKDEEERRGSENENFVRTKSGYAWVIGTSGDKDPQLWFEKDTFLPMRIVFNTTVSGPYDVRMENYRFQHDFPYPRTLTVMNAGSSAFLRDELVEVIVNPDAASLKVPSGGPANGYTDAGNSASSSVRDLIQEYYQIVR